MFEHEEAIKTLRSMGVKKGSAIFATVTYPERRSSNTKKVSVYIVAREVVTDYKTGKRTTTPTIYDVSGLVGLATGIRRHADGPLLVSACGLDAGLHVVTLLSRRMFPNVPERDYALRYRRL